VKLVISMYERKLRNSETIFNKYFKTEKYNKNYLYSKREKEKKSKNNNIEAMRDLKYTSTEILAHYRINIYINHIY
jgi:hypothetical protein